MCFGISFRLEPQVACFIGTFVGFIMNCLLVLSVELDLSSASITLIGSQLRFVDTF